ncbi:MAG: RIP metalloprotease RseP [Selenomonadaceae bacterium]|nr:RIP metalloprotease RseP [Selenomonadaceae bacterium]MBP3722854.1 RIP metalloprotease RseP [Selenomonadaceae bacterium]
MTVLAVIVVFGVLVLVHELGHFVTAKLTGMRVDEFAIGFGPKIISHKRGETTYSIRAVPLGGFNDIAGMTKEDNKAGERGYCEKSIPKRMIVIIAGSMMNLLLPVFIFWGLFFFNGVSTPSDEPILGGVAAGKPAEQAGLRAGDKILTVNGAKITVWSDVVNNVRAATDEITIDYERDGKKSSVKLESAYDEMYQRNMIGVMGTTITTPVGFIDSFTMAVKHTVNITMQMIAELGRLLSKFSGDGLAGPVGVVHMTGKVAEMGIAPLLNFTAFLSLNLGIINLLPIPVLDGGHFLALMIEGIIRKPINGKVLYAAQIVGMTLLLMLMLYATKNDITRLFLGGQ